MLPVQMHMQRHPSQRQPPRRQMPRRPKPLKARPQPSQSLHPLRQWWCPSLQNLWWPCVVTTALVKRKPKHRQAVMAVVMAEPGTAMPVRATGPVIVQAVLAIVAPARVTAATVFLVVISQTVANAHRAWAIPLSARNARPWSVQRCPCASWQLKPTVRP
jgi:hypothetical protein